MYSSSRRSVYANGANSVLMMLNSSPWIAAYRFSFASGWGTRYSDPSPALSPMGGVSDGFLLSVGTGNTRVLLPNNRPELISIGWTHKNGFGSVTKPTFGSGANSRTVVLNQSGTRAMVAGYTVGVANSVSEYAYTSGGGVGSLSYNSAVPSGNIHWAKLILNDSYFIASRTGQIETYARSSSTTPISVNLTPLCNDNPGSMSPIVYPSSTRLFAFATTGGAVGLLRYNTNGTLVGAITSTMGSNASAVTFDKYGRLIVGRTSNAIDVYTINSSFVQTLVEGITGISSPAFTGTRVNHLEYDFDNDVLFVSSTTTPFVSAYRMGGSGFISKYADPGTAIGIQVKSTALHYADAWKYTRT